MHEGLKRLKEEFNENPIAVLGVISVALAAAGKLINAVGAYQGRRAYAKDVNRRIKSSTYGKSKRYPHAN